MKFINTILIMLILMSSLSFAALDLSIIKDSQNLNLGESFSVQAQVLHSTNSVLGADCDIEVFKYDGSNYFLIAKESAKSVNGQVSYNLDSTNWQELSNLDILAQPLNYSVSCSCIEACYTNTTTPLDKQEQGMASSSVNVLENESKEDLNVIPLILMMGLFFAMMVWLYTTLDWKEHSMAKVYILGILMVIINVTLFMIKRIADITTSNATLQGFGDWYTYIFTLNTVMFIVYPAWYIINNKKLEDG